MEQSILNSTKKILGFDPEYTAFDLDIITNINTVLDVLHQLGIGPVEGFVIEDESATWEDFLGVGKHLSAVKTYVHLRVRLVFDPPQTSYHINAIQEQVKELEQRISMYREEAVYPLDETGRLSGYPV